MPLNPIRNFECEILTYMPEDRIMMINSKPDHLQKLKSNGNDKPIIITYKNLIEWKMMHINIQSILI